jgi:hypothetical protein
MTFPALRTPHLPLQPLVIGLGWFSIGLGLAELLAPRQLSRRAGMREQNSLIRGYGLREIGTGLGLLLSTNPRPWLWGRVAGDILDAATVAATANPRRTGRLGVSSAALLGVGLLDLYSAIRSGAQRYRPRPGAAPEKDYSRRSGFPRAASQMRGAALRRTQKTSPEKTQAAE